MKKSLRKSIVVVLMLVIAVMSLVGCADEGRTITDLEGNEVVLGSKVEKIVSTAPSNTKILVELGLTDKIVGISNYDALEGDYLKIDFKNPDVEAIVALEPDVIIASGHNKTGSEDPFKLLKEAGIAVVYIPSADSIEGIYESIEFIGDVVNLQDKASEVADTMRAGIEEVKAKAAEVTEKKSVYFEISPVPSIFTTGSGTFQHELIEIIGAENIFASETGWFSPSIEDILDREPDIIVTNVTYMENAVEEILSREGFAEFEVVLIDGDLTSQPAPAVVDALWMLGKLVYPEVFND